jgi:6-phosphogluconolactonase
VGRSLVTVRLPSQSAGTVKRFLLPLFLTLTAAAGTAEAETFYLGTYTKPGGSEGIYRYELDPATGAVQDRGLAAKSSSPSFLVLHPSKKYLYAVNEASGGGASAFDIQPDGTLKELNRESTLGSGPTHVAIDREGKNILVANYGGGSVAVLPIKEDGSLGKTSGFIQHTGSGPNKQRQKEPHTHSVYVDASNQRVLAADLGLDKVFLYRFDAMKGTIAPGEPPFAIVAPGAGPRHLALSASGLVYLVNEMGNTVSVLAPESGGLKEVQSISTLPAGFSGASSTAEIALHPNGKFLYVSNRGHDSIASFAVAEDGRLTALAHMPTGGKDPRFFGIHPEGKLLFAANQTTGNVRVFKLDPATGALSETGVEFQRPQPVCIVFMPPAQP